jgi:ABC-type glycerol-3-phosphate transport system permease component
MSTELRVRKIQGEGWLAKRVNLALGYGILLVTGLFLFIPIFFLLVNSLKNPDDSEFVTWPVRVFPAVPHWENFLQIFNRTNFGPIAGRTFLIAIGFALISTFMTALAGYGFARYQVPGSKRLYSIVIAMMFVPGMVLTIPQFIIFARLHLTNTYWPWLIWALVPGSVGIFLFRQFFMNFPKELEEAAEMDGASPWRIFLQIFLPNAKPVLSVSMIWNFSWVWGDYLTPLLFLSGEKTLLPVALQTAFLRPHSGSYVILTLAGNVIYCLPLIIAFFLAQKYILKGIVTTGLKG